MNTILFPTDFSDNSRRALPFAALLAQTTGSRLLLLHVYGVPLSEYATAYENVPVDVSALIQKGLESAQTRLNALRDELLGSASAALAPEAVATRAEYGFAPETILRVAEQWTAQYIVMSTRGATNAVDQFLGTAASGVVAKATCPVLVIPDRAVFSTPQRVLYAAAFEHDETERTRAALAFSNLFGAETTVLHVREYGEYTEVPPAETVAQLRKTFAGERIHFRNLNRIELIEGLEIYVRHYRPDVLVFTKRRRGFWESLFHRSVTKHFVQEGTRPMLILPA
jgi:nucleotide-binding universal stress UspA family protein